MKNQMINQKKKFSFASVGPYLVAFLVPILVMIIVFIERGIWPFGAKCFLRTDLYHQYAPFFKELQTKLTSGGSLFYSWNIGAGTNFWALAAYYLASPLNILVVLVPADYLIEFVTSMIVFKIALSSVTMTYYLNSRHEKRGAEGYNAVFFGVFYSLSGWMAAYNWNIMWLDAVILFPLIILGLDRLVRENKGLLYGIALGVTMFSNYYMAIMVSFGVAVYCFYLLATEREIFKNFGVKLLKFIGYTVLAVALSAVFLLPYIRFFGMTASANSTFKWEWNSYFSVFDMMARQLINVEVETGLDHWPNIYAGIAVFLLIPLYFMNKKITLREKIGYTFMVVFYYFSFSTRAMDYIWHGFHIPNSLPCRQSFIFIFLLMVMSYRGLSGLKDRSYRDVGFAMLAALSFIFLAEKLETNTEVFTNYVFYISALFAVLYAIVFYTMKRSRMYRDIVIVILIALAAIETCVNTSVTSVPTVTRSDYVSYDDGITAAMKIIREKEGANAFYRVEKADYRTKNDGAWLNFPSVSTFSSTANANLTTFYKTIGLEASTNAYGSMGQTQLTNMLMGVKYTIEKKELPENDLYTLVSSNGKNVWVYENKYALPLGYSFADPSIITEWSDSAISPLENQNQLVKKVLGEKTLFIDETPHGSMSTTVYFTTEEDGFYYAYSTKSGPKKIKVTTSDDSFSREFSNLNRGYTMTLGYLKKGTTVTLTNKEDNSTKNISLSVYRLDEEVLGEFYDAVSETALQVDTFTDTEITAHIDVKDEGTLVMTEIAAEEGWEVFVDGEKTEYETLKGAYIGLKLAPGRHNITFKYHVPFFLPSLGITVLAGLIFLIIALSPLFRRKKKVTVNETEVVEEVTETTAEEATVQEAPTGEATAAETATDEATAPETATDESTAPETATDEATAPETATDESLATETPEGAPENEITDGTDAFEAPVETESTVSPVNPIGEIIGANDQEISIDEILENNLEETKTE